MINVFDNRDPSSRTGTFVISHAGQLSATRGSGTEVLAAILGVEARVSGPVGFRWFRHAGGVNPRLPSEVSGRYLSFSEQEDLRFGMRRRPAPARSPPAGP